MFYTWDYIASVLGLCNTMPLVQFSEAEEGYLKLIGGAAKVLQRFSDPCEQNRGAKYLKDELEKRKVTTKESVILKLQTIVDDNIVLTNLHFANKKLLQTMSVQVALRALGMDKFNYTTLVAEPQQKTYVEKPYDPNDPWVKLMRASGNSEESVKKMWKNKTKPR